MANALTDTVTDTQTTFQRENLVTDSMEYFSIMKWPLKPNLLPNFDYFQIIIFFFMLIKTYIAMKEVRNIRKIKFFLAPIPILKLNLGFGSGYQNLVLVVHYYYVLGK